MSRASAIGGFLQRHGYGAAQAAPLAQDASFRRYLRLTGGPRPAVLMDAPPPEDVRPFLRIAAHLAAIGLSVPEIIAADAESGLVLEEDLGDALLSALIDGMGAARADEIKTPPPPLAGLGREADQGGGEGAVEVARGQIAPLPPPILGPLRGPSPQGEGEESSTSVLLHAAADVLVAIQRAAPLPDLPAWDAATMAQTALGTLLDWWWPAAFGAPAPAAARIDFTAALRDLLRPIAAGPVCFTHRDYFAGNLLWLPDRPGLRRIGVLDFQSAALGHPAYDLVSLLQDARRDIPAAAAASTIDHYLAARPELDADAFHAAYAACAAQRHLRVACQWVRLALRDGRRQYLAHGPRTWRKLAEALRHPAAAPLAQVMDRWIPADLRGNPKGLTA